MASGIGEGSLLAGDSNIGIASKLASYILGIGTAQGRTLLCKARFTRRRTRVWGIAPTGNQTRRGGGMEIPGRPVPAMILQHPDHLTITSHRCSSTPWGKANWMHSEPNSVTMIGNFRAKASMRAVHWAIVSRPMPEYSWRIRVDGVDHSIARGIKQCATVGNAADLVGPVDAAGDDLTFFAPGGADCGDQAPAADRCVGQSGQTASRSSQSAGHP